MLRVIVSTAVTFLVATLMAHMVLSILDKGRK